MGQGTSLLPVSERLTSDGKAILLCLAILWDDQGFDDGVDTVWLPSNPVGMHQTIKRLYNEEGKDRKLFIAGHSLGGALATIAAARLVFVDNMNIAGMYTMGSPR